MHIIRGTWGMPTYIMRGICVGKKICANWDVAHFGNFMAGNFLGRNFLTRIRLDFNVYAALFIYYLNIRFECMIHILVKC